MKFLNYFFYIAFHWNLRIAWFMIQYEFKGEKKYDINTTSIDNLKKLEKLGIDVDHATMYMPISYYLLDIIFEEINKMKEKMPIHFLDIGCGKGRAMCVAAHKDCSKVSGIDFSKNLCDDADVNLKITQNKIPSLQFKIINNDAFYFEIPNDVDCILLFNPFDEIIMSGVIENITKSLILTPRKMHIIYANPLHQDLFINAGFRELIHFQKLQYLEFVILEN